MSGNPPEYEFTQDWFYWAPEVWQQLFPEKIQTALEIGSFEGRSSVWIIENLLAENGTLTCIDTWGGSMEHTQGEMVGAEERFKRNIAVAAQHFPDRSVRAQKGKSIFELADLIHYGGLNSFDFIYLDGSHKAKDVLTDACMAWPLLKPEGVMIFDDFLWGPVNQVLDRPKMAVDAFTTLFATKIQFLHLGYQVAVRKLPAASHA